MNANSYQVGGSHYVGAVQHWDVVEQVYCGRYFESCASKYVLRHRKKDGVKDLAKARHFCEKLRQEYSGGRVESMATLHARRSATARFNGQLSHQAYAVEVTRCFDEFTAGSNDIEKAVMWALVYWTDADVLGKIIAALSEMIAAAGGEK